MTSNSDTPIIVAGAGIGGLSAALMLRHSLGLEDEAGSVEAAVAAVLSAGAVTQDLGGSLGTRAAANAVIDGLRAIHWAAAHRIQMHWA